MKEPLNLPRGSVRAILTCALVFVCALMLFIPIAPGADEIRTMFLLLTGIVVRDYFSVRAEQNKEDGPVVPDPVIYGE